MSNNNKELAKEILENIGGSSNIHNISYCMTRLRFVAKDDSKVNVEQLKKIPGVLQVIKLGNQYQVVLGGIVDEVYREILSMQKESMGSKDEGHSAITEDSSKKVEEIGWSAAKKFQTNIKEISSQSFTRYSNTFYARLLVHLRFDIDFIKKSGYLLQTPIILPEKDKIASMEITEKRNVSKGDPLMEVDLLPN